MKNDNRIEVDLVLLLTIILVALRLDGVLQWPWMVVLSPIMGVNLIKLIMIIVLVLRGKKR